MEKEIINIEHDPDNEMLSIIKDGVVLFNGSEWDFDRSPESFTSLFTKLGFNVQVEKKEME